MYRASPVRTTVPGPLPSYLTRVFEDEINRAFHADEGRVVDRAHAHLDAYANMLHDLCKSDVYAEYVYVQFVAGASAMAQAYV
jgi:hypothetical protein